MFRYNVLLFSAAALLVSTQAAIQAGKTHGHGASTRKNVKSFSLCLTEGGQFLGDDDDFEPATAWFRALAKCDSNGNPTGATVAYTSLNCQNNYYFGNGTFEFGAHDDDNDLLPVIPCTESILFIADATATTKAGGKCAKTKYGDIYNTITSTFSYVVTDLDGIRDCREAANDEVDEYKCLTDHYTRMGGLAVAQGPNYKNNKPHFVDVDYLDEADVYQISYNKASGWNPFY